MKEKKLGKEGRSITQHLPPLKGPRIPSRSLMLIWCQGGNRGLKFHLKFATSDLSSCNYEQWNWLSPTFYQIHPYCVLHKIPAWPYRTNWSWVISVYYLHCCRYEVNKRRKWRGLASWGTEVARGCLYEVCFPVHRKSGISAVSEDFLPSVHKSVFP